MGYIKTDLAALRNDAKKFEDNATEYNDQLKKINSAIERLKPDWTDQAGKEFFEAYEAKYNIVKEMGPAIQGLSEAITKVCNTMNTAIDESIGAFK